MSYYKFWLLLYVLWLILPNQTADDIVNHRVYESDNLRISKQVQNEFAVQNCEYQSVSISTFTLKPAQEQAPNLKFIIPDKWPF